MSLCAKIFARNGNVLHPRADGFRTGHEPVHSSKSGTCVSIDSQKDEWFCANETTCGIGGGPIQAIINLEGKSYAEAEAEVLQMGGKPQKRPPRIASLMLNDHGKPRPLLYNVFQVLEHEPRFAKALRFNRFNNCVELHEPPPPYDASLPWSICPLHETHTSDITAWIQRTFEVCAASKVVEEALIAFAYKHTYHPVVDYLDALVWDGQERLDTWLTTYCAVADTPYSRAVGAMTLIGGVARAYDPGCKLDTMLILQGDQGLGKSTVLRILASDAWFADHLPDLHNKDAAIALLGKWIVEIAELANFRRSAVETINRFVSATQDHFRAPYARNAATVRRAVIFAGTTNKDSLFTDETGSRRYLPVRVLGRCAVDELHRDRDQLWAEAVKRHRDGEAWHITDPDLLQTAEMEQAARYEDDPWTNLILGYVEKPGREPLAYKGMSVNFVTTLELFKEALHLDTAQWTSISGRRAAAILRHAGWREARIDNPVKDAVPRQLRGFYSQLPELPDTRPPSGSSSDPHKSLLMPELPELPDDSYKPTENRVADHTKTYTSRAHKTTREAGCLSVKKLLKKIPAPSGSSGTEPVTVVETTTCQLPDVLWYTVSTGENHIPLLEYISSSH